MTHGAGAISSGGGGGGFSGGGFSHTPIYHGGRRRSRDSGTGDAGCCFLCVAVGYLVAFLLCLISMKPRTRVVLVWFYCILGAGLGGGLLSQRYRDQDIPSSPTDQREVTGISSVFCEQLTISSDVPMSTYVFEDRKPKVNTSAFLNYTYTATSSIPNNNYEYWGYYLLQGSMLYYTICPDDSGLEVFIIKGKKDLNKWLNDPYCDDCYEESHFASFCHDPKNPPRSWVSIQDSDDYYVLLVSRSDYVIPPIFTTIRFDLRRTRYDLGPSSLICYEEMLCSIPFMVMSTEYFVFDVPRDSPRDIDVTIMCEDRVYLYVIIFGLLPIMIGIFITVLILKRARQQEARRNRTESQVFSISVGDPQSGVNALTNPVAAGAAPNGPPSYTKYASQGEGPPSYEQLYGTQ